MEKLKKYCQFILPFSDKEMELIDLNFKEINLKNKEFLFKEGNICNFIGFVASGLIRHFHIRDGIEKTCDLSPENSWVTDFQSFNLACSGMMNLQALGNTTIYYIQKENLYQLYKDNPKFETFGRIMAEKVAQRATEIAMSLSSEKPEERFVKLIQQQPDIFQLAPQKYIANFLGFSPESLSRIRKRVFEKSKS